MSTKILIIDDDTTFDAMYSKKFSDAGFKVSIITTPSQNIVSEVRHKSPDLILMDLLFSTSDLNGVSLATMLQANKHTKSIPIIYLTNAQIGHLGDEVKKLPSTIGFYIKVNAIPSEMVKRVSECYAEFLKKNRDGTQ
ncbi:response regulator [Candidatus Parcubacteria bacterium]|nr:response regulator [Candidatus Parcubacteria bacterium]